MPSIGGVGAGAGTLAVLGTRFVRGSVGVLARTGAGVSHVLFLIIAGIASALGGMALRGRGHVAKTGTLPLDEV